MDVINSSIQIPDELKNPLASLANKMDKAIATYGIGREELLNLIAKLLEGGNG